MELCRAPPVQTPGWIIAASVAGPGVCSAHRTWLLHFVLQRSQASPWRDSEGAHSLGWARVGPLKRSFYLRAGQEPSSKAETSVALLPLPSSSKALGNLSLFATSSPKVPLENLS